MGIREMEAVRKASFGERYRRIVRALDEQNREEKKNEFRQVEDAVLFLITYIIANQDRNGWWNYGNPYYKVLTAHAVRLLHKLGLTLRSRWNLDGSSFTEGNLFHSTERLLESFDTAPDPARSRWDEDVWDDCWILLALLEVEPDFAHKEIQKAPHNLKREFDSKLHQSVKWLQQQFDVSGFNQRIAGAKWFGPAHYAAAIELFDHPLVKERFSAATANIEMLALGVGPVLEQGLNSTQVAQWNSLFAWHIGQFVVTWKKKRETHDVIRTLDEPIRELFKKLIECQHEDGFWGPEKSSDEAKVYNTDRALEACYVYMSDDEAVESTQVAKAHKYLLNISRTNAGGAIQDVKGSINTLEAFQKLFEFGIREIFPNELWALATRLNKFGILDSALSSVGTDSNALTGIRTRARIRLEEQGKSGLELLGINHRLYHRLKDKEEFLKEFTDDRMRTPSEPEREEIRKELRRFLSATLTETRSKSSRALIRALWKTDGFLNFIPLIEHLSDLEQDRAFYKYYRDHLNHEVLLFLLGVYIYDNCAAFRTPVDEEICRIYDEKKIRFDKADLEGEFLFRWKLISTFHDVGYLFEVDPVKDKSTRTFRTKNQLLKKSFRVVDEFRKNFLFDYFAQYVTPLVRIGVSVEETESDREQTVRKLTEEIGELLVPYKGTIKNKESLFKLSTPEGPFRNSFNLISQYVKLDYPGERLVEDYFKLCDTTPVTRIESGKEVVKREPFLDHGVMSALVLLKAADIQRHYLWELTQRDFSGTLLYEYPQLREALEKPVTKASLTAKQFFIRFSHVAGAIALHNISPQLYTREQCAKFDAERGTAMEKAFYQPIGERERYIIGLDENPLSYLTALADTLQDWDRHSFRRLAFDQESGDPLSTSDVIIDCDENDKINVRPLTRPAREKYGSLAKPEAMDQYLKDWRTHVTIHTGELL